MIKQIEGGEMHYWDELEEERMQQKIDNEIAYREWKNSTIVKWMSFFRQWL